MYYQIFPNIIFLLSVFGILMMILRHLPDTASIETEAQPHVITQQKLLEKGLPAQAISKLKVATVFVAKKIWNFMLEAKDLRPHAEVGYRMKKIFGGRLPTFNKPQVFAPPSLQEVKNEQYYLDIIKVEPKNLRHYDGLGKFYLEKENINDAKDIYQYLVNHQPGNPEYQARLAYCFYAQKNFEKAAEHYQKSVSLDSTQPNRFYNLGLSLKSIGKKTQAAAAFKKAGDLEPSSEKYQKALKSLEN